MAENNWSTPFDPVDFGEIPMFVWCPTKELAEELLKSYGCEDVNEMVHLWDHYEGETVYTTPGKTTKYGWLHGCRNSYDRWWADHGYVPRVFHGVTTPAEVGDLL